MSDTKLIFPITHCPNCHGTTFKTTAQMYGTTEIFYENNGEYAGAHDKTKHVRQKLSKMWACATCETQLFETTDIKL